MPLTRIMAVRTYDCRDGYNVKERVDIFGNHIVEDLIMQYTAKINPIAGKLTMEAIVGKSRLLVPIPNSENNSFSPKDGIIQVEQLDSDVRLIFIEEEQRAWLPHSLSSLLRSIQSNNRIDSEAVEENNPTIKKTISLKKKENHLNTINKLQGEIKRLTTANTELTMAKTKAIALADSLSDTIGNMYSGQQLLQISLTTANEKILAAEKKIIDLTRELNAETVKYETIRSIYLQAQQEYIVLEDENIKLRAKLKNAGVADSHFLDQSDHVSYQEPRAGRSAIESKIKAVKNGYASIPVGIASGVRKDMKFIIYRVNINGKPSYVGDLTIKRVEKNEAVGLLVVKTGKVLPGDNVTTAKEKFKGGR